MNVYIENEYLRGAILFFITIIIAEAIRFILNNYAERLVRKTTSDLDDTLLKIIRGPIRLMLYTMAVYLFVHTIDIPLRYDRWVDRVFYAIIVITGASVISKICSTLLGKWLRVENRYEQTPRLVGKIVSVIVYAIGFMMILRHYEVEITPLIATLGVGGVAVGLALQPTLSNFFSGLFIISDKPVNVGDFIELHVDGLAGYVEDIGWRTTRIRTMPNTLVIVPNSKLADSIIVNNSLPEQEMTASVDCGVAYGSDLERVQKVTIEVATGIQQRIEGAVKDFTPLFRYNKFGDSNINFTVILRVLHFADQFPVKHEFIKSLADRFQKENIDISWPIRKIYTAS